MGIYIFWALMSWISQLPKTLLEPHQLTASITVAPTFVPAPTVLPTQVPSPTASPTLPPKKIPSPLSTPSSNPSLLSAINVYRSEKGLPKVSSEPTLCRLAHIRVNELAIKNTLDHHAGLEGHKHELSEFSSWAEVIYTSSASQNATNIVRAWDSSTAGHKEAISDPIKTLGCGATKGNFAVFLLGTK